MPHGQPVRARREDRSVSRRAGGPSVLRPPSAARNTTNLHAHPTKSSAVADAADCATGRPQGCSERPEMCRLHPSRGRACTVAPARTQLVSGVATVQTPHTGCWPASAGDVRVGPRRAWHAPAGGGGILGGPAHRHPNSGAAGPSFRLRAREVARHRTPFLKRAIAMSSRSPLRPGYAYRKGRHAGYIAVRFVVRLRRCSAGRKKARFSVTPSICSIS